MTASSHNALIAIAFMISLYIEQGKYLNLFTEIIYHSIEEPK